MATITTRTALAAALTTLGVGALALAPAGSGTALGNGDGGTRWARADATPPVLPLPRPEDFVRTVDHPYLPFVPGMRWVYRSHQDGEIERIEVKVLDRTRTIEGITATVVRDTVSTDGELVEDTFDWYAQDTAGNVWYLGEATEEYADDGTVDTEGSWEAGKHGASAGILMPADPVIGRTYRQEFREGVAEDMARMVDQDTMVKVPFGFFGHTWLTEETTPLEPRTNELKFYARGIGVVEEDSVSPRSGRTVLVTFQQR